MKSRSRSNGTHALNHYQAIFTAMANSPSIRHKSIRPTSLLPSVNSMPFPLGFAVSPTPRKEVSKPPALPFLRCFRRTQYHAPFHPENSVFLWPPSMIQAQYVVEMKSPAMLSRTSRSTPGDRRGRRRYYPSARISIFQNPLQLSRQGEQTRFS